MFNPKYCAGLFNEIIKKIYRNQGHTPVDIEFVIASISASDGKVVKVARKQDWPDIFEFNEQGLLAWCMAQSQNIVISLEKDPRCNFHVVVERWDHSRDRHLFSKRRIILCFLNNQGCSINFIGPLDDRHAFRKIPHN